MDNTENMSVKDQIRGYVDRIDFTERQAQDILALLDEMLLG